MSIEIKCKCDGPGCDKFFYVDECSSYKAQVLEYGWAISKEDDTAHYCERCQGTRKSQIITLRSIKKDIK